MSIEYNNIELLGNLIEHLGSLQFPQKLADSCQRLSSYESTVITAFVKNSRPKLLFDNLTDNQKATSLTPYTNGAYLLDPFYQLHLRNSSEQLYLLKDIAPDEFFVSEYYRTYYAGTKLSDEVGLWVNLNQNHHILISLGVRHSSIKQTRQLDELQFIASALLALCRKHWQSLTFETELSSDPLDLAFDANNFSLLSDREKEIIRMILKGHSSKSIARILNISPETVKVHRKRAHSKLGTSSQAELFSLFLKAVSQILNEYDLLLT